METVGSQITAILWDNDNTLMDFEYSLHKALKACFGAFHLKINDRIIARYEEINTSYWKRLERGEVTKAELLDGRFRDLFSELGYTVDVPEFRRLFQVELGSYYSYLDDSLEVCKALQGKVKQYIVTNGVLETQMRKITASGFGELMEEIFISEVLGYEKPRKEFFDGCMEKLSEKDPSKILIVGDSLTSDIKGGNNAGIRTCWYNPHGKKAGEEYKIDYEIRNLWEIFEVLGLKADYNVRFKPAKKVWVVKKDGSKVPFQVQKVIDAVSKSAYRALTSFTPEEECQICRIVVDKVNALKQREVPIAVMHNIVESALEQTRPAVAKSYRDYRNYKQDFVRMLDDVYMKSQSIMYIGDKENSNTDSALVSTKRSLIFNQFNKSLYQKFFMTAEEIQATRDGYIYIHDMSSRRDTMNCCLFDIGSVLSGGFEMGNIWYNEPKTLDVAFDVMGDIILSAASQQYGGFTVPSVDLLLEPYAEKSDQRNLAKYLRLGISREAAEEESFADVVREFEQGFQGWEYKFNTVASSRGDYPFITVTAGTGTGKFAKQATISLLNVRREGQGKKGHKKPVLFPKIVFLYDENLHGPGGELEEVFEAGIRCSAKTMYPDWLSLTGEGYVPEMYKKYGQIISPMGCRAFLSPWYERGGMKPADDEDKPVFVGRFNIGAVSLHLPMILAKAREEQKDFYQVLDYYLNMIRQLHIRTYEYLGELRASTNPLAYCQGGFYKGHLGLHDKIKPLLEYATASFGITALNELQQLYNGKSLVEDGAFALEVLTYINSQVARFKEEDGRLYAIYGTPAENLCGEQVQQFRKKYGVVKGVSDREYVSNSFHCHVTEDITPIRKQDLENRFWNLCNGGKIQYVKYPIDYNLEAIRTLVRRAMKMGFYEGVNLSLAYCDDCGYQELEMDVCPKCGSTNLTKIERMNGYLSYSRIHGDTRLNAAKMAEIEERRSM